MIGSPEHVALSCAKALLSRKLRRGAIAGAVAGLLLFQAGCASVKQAPPPGAEAEDEAPADPLEPMNRFLFDSNQKFDKYAVRPVSQAYIAVVPEFLRNGISNILSNLSSPAVLMNDLAQGNLRCAGETLGRISVNTLVGVGGFFDVGERVGLPRHKADFGQTLGAWGVGPGPYLFVPAVGPLNLRDAGGFVIDSAADPFTIEMSLAHINEANYVRLGMTPVDFRARNMQLLDDLQRNSLDPYAFERSAARQLREAAIDRAMAPVSLSRCSLGSD